MTDRELMQQALEVLEQYTDVVTSVNDPNSWITVADGGKPAREAIAALRERLAQPEFIKHEEGGDGWSDWVCPDPDDYLFKCCDCGLVHEAQFRVVKYAPAPLEECEIVNDPNLQAVFRMRRSQRWTPDDTAYRPGGLAQPQPATREEKIVRPGVYEVTGPLHVVCQCDKCKAQPEQEPVAWAPVSAAMPKPGVTVLACYKNSHDKVRRIRAKWVPAKTQEAYGDDDFGEYDEEADTYWTPEGWYECIDNWGEYSSVFVGEGEVTHWMPMPTDPYTAPPRREWVGLTDEEKLHLEIMGGKSDVMLAEAIEAKLKEKNT